MKIPEMSNIDDAELNNMSEVKIWRPTYQYPPMEKFRKPNGLFQKYGPFHTDSHTERKKIVTKLLEELNIDWEHPDEVIHVTPKWGPAILYVK